MEKRKILTLLGPLGITSLVAMSFQLTLTRFFSVILWYHFVFIVISAALMGIGIGGWLLFRTRLTAWLLHNPGPRLMLLELLFGLSMLASLGFAINSPYLDLLFIYVLIASVPFILQGIIAAFLFSQFPTSTGLLYTADLVGTALGGLAEIFAVRYLGPPQTALALSLLSILIAPVYLLALGVEEKKGRKQAQVGAWQQRLFWVGTLFLLALATLGAWSLRQDTVQQWIARGATPVSGKTMFELMGDLNVESRVVFSGWDEFARTDVVEQAGLETKKYIFTDGGAASYMSSFNGNPESIEALTTDAGYFPFTWGKRNKVLIIGAGGGRDLLIALRGGSQEIIAVEINRNIIKAMDQFASFNGNLYRRPEIQLVIGDGRNFVRKANAKYDLIYLPLVFTQAATSSGYGLVENYIFTQEAFAEYFSRLHPKGRLVLKLHGAEDLTKAALTAIELLQKKKANLSPAAAMQHLLIINGMNNKEHAQQKSQPHFPLLIIRPGLPFSATEAKQLQAKAMEMGYEPLYTPWVQKEGVFGSMEDGFLTPAQLIRRANVQLEPANDNKPFFYNVEKGIPKNICLARVI